ncbi:Cof-type HAD-IIB family hydrolase [Neisseriaceae bacterium B1]
MQKQQPKIIFFDIDNTLYITPEKRIPESTYRALAELKKRGIITAIATGRTIATMPPLARQLIEDNNIDMVVAINGQYIQYKGQTLTAFPLDKDTVMDFAAQLREKEIAHGFVADDGVSVGLNNPYLTDACAFVGIDYVEDKTHPETRPVYQMLAFYPVEKDEEINFMLPESLKPIRWHEFGVDILSKEGSKARGIQAALDKLGLNMSDAMAFGDGLNDLEMIAAAGFGVVMANGEPELKAIADHICPAAVDDGIYRALVDLGVIEDVQAA